MGDKERVELRSIEKKRIQVCLRLIDGEEEKDGFLLDWGGGGKGSRTRRALGQKANHKKKTSLQRICNARDS